MNLESLTAIFDRSVGSTHNTFLQGGAPEPIYVPGYDAGEPNVIHFRDDYVSSALHEIAHWCIAGARRRRLEDYGYWYKGNRGVWEQRDFEAVEVRPQALEWILSNAAGVPFRVSCDNFDVKALDMTGFRRQVQKEVPLLLQRMPDRAAVFIEGLLETSGCYGALKCESYQELPG